jgi:hypothetical protein
VAQQGQESDVRLRFGDTALARAATVVGFCPAGWTLDVLDEFRFVLSLLDGADTLDDLKPLKFADVRPAVGSANQWSVAVGMLHRLILELPLEERRVVVIRELVRHA